MAYQDVPAIVSVYLKHNYPHVRSKDLPAPLFDMKHYNAQANRKGVCLLVQIPLEK